MRISDVSSAASQADRPAHRKVAMLGIILLALMMVVGTVGALSVRSIQQDLGVLVNDEGRILADLQALHQSVLRGQLALERAATASADDRAALLSSFDDALAEVVPRWDQSVGDERSPNLSTDPAVFNEWVVSASRFRAHLATAAADADLTDVRASFDKLAASFEADSIPLAHTVQDTAKDASNRARQVHNILLVIAAIGLAIGAILSRSSYRSARAQHHEIDRRDYSRIVEARRNRNQARIAQALDYARTERDALRAVERSVRELHPERPTELLLADSSRAHFEIAMRVPGHDERPGCTVPTPADCPAVARGQALVFPSSEHFDACPYLQDRPGDPVSAVCVPVSISGTAEGVLHSTGANGEQLDPETRHTLDLLAVRAGDRIGVLRAFSRSESQAATDPLTGLANRRSFEDQVAALLRNGTQVTIAFGDLDHFKQLNDTHGHDAGDRALRTFSRTFRHVVRPGDLIARWGGEEFVAAFPATPSPAVVNVLHRLQRQLADVVANGDAPPFTVSFGVADHHDGDDLQALVTAADRALLTAKRTGRDRIMLASPAQSTSNPSHIISEDEIRDLTDTEHEARTPEATSAAR